MAIRTERKAQQLNVPGNFFFFRMSVGMKNFCVVMATDVSQHFPTDTDLGRRGANFVKIDFSSEIVYFVYLND